MARFFAGWALIFGTALGVGLWVFVSKVQATLALLP
jgi:hypothetical protein